MTNEPKRNQIDRRRFLTTASAGTLALTPAAGQAALLVTPSQTEGPFYPRKQDLFPDIDNDLVLITDRARKAGGTILQLGGRVVDADGNAVEGAVVEIWQCDTNGRYLHGGDRSQHSERDAYFQGYGYTKTDGDGRYEFRTIKPVPYPGRTPHIHFKVHGASGENLTTQMYVAGDPGNAGDGLYARLTRDQRDRLTVELRPAADDALAGSFEIVVPWRT